MSKGQRRHSAPGHSLEKLKLAEPRCLGCHHPKDSGETPPYNRKSAYTPSRNKGREGKIFTVLVMS